MSEIRSDEGTPAAVEFVDVQSVALDDGADEVMLTFWQKHHRAGRAVGVIGLLTVAAFGGYAYRHTADSQQIASLKSRLHDVGVIAGRDERSAYAAGRMAGLAQAELSELNSHLSDDRAYQAVPSVFTVTNWWGTVVRDEHGRWVPFVRNPIQFGEPAGKAVPSGSPPTGSYLGYYQYDKFAGQWIVKQLKFDKRYAFERDPGARLMPDQSEVGEVVVAQDHRLTAQRLAVYQDGHPVTGTDGSLIAVGVPLG